VMDWGLFSQWSLIMLRIPICLTADSTEPEPIEQICSA